MGLRLNATDRVEKLKSILYSIDGPRHLHYNCAAVCKHYLHVDNGAN